MTGYENLSALAEKNGTLLDKLNFDPRKDNPFELDSPNTFSDSGLFTSEAIDCIFNDKAPAPLLTAQRVTPKYGMVLVRPDMAHIAPQVETFIDERFQLADVTNTVVTPEIYWEMYGDAMVSRETRQSRLTRAAVYINSLCRLIVFERSETKVDGVPAADYTFKYLKGKQGVRQSGTLRGDLVYNGAIKANLHTLTDEQTALAVDPFGAYRKIVCGSIESPCHTLTHPLLFFTGVGIHIPDFQEVQRDLTLFNPSDREKYAA
jgi:hypothetical protein